MPKRIQDVIKENMDLLQAMMESGKHLTDHDTVVDQYNKCLGYSHHMEEEDSDYLSCAATAIEDQLPWNVPNMTDITDPKDAI
jgi:hypothetical protein